MRRKSNKTSGPLPAKRPCSALKPATKIWSLAVMAIWLPWIAAAEVHAQRPGQQTKPGDSGLGPAAPWSVEGYPEPRDSQGVRRPPREGGLWPRSERRERPPLGLRCEILEIEELGRLYVQEIPAGQPFWLQLPDEVKLRSGRRSSFGGRKKLTLEDLEVGQRLVVKMKKGTDEIVKVLVSPAKI